MRHSPSPSSAFLLLGTVLAGALVLSAAVGAFAFTPTRMLELLSQAAGYRPALAADALDRNVFLSLRLPRVLIAALCGAVLGVGGTVMQGLFRNPIVEPGLVGTSAGAAFGAACVIVVGGAAPAPWPMGLGVVALPVGAFAGALAASWLTYRVAAAAGRMHVFTLLLTGIAVNALCTAGTAYLSYVARDPQARNITFWSLGTFTTASASSVTLVAFTFLIGYSAIVRDAKRLDALLLGEDVATSLGTDVRGLARRVLVLNTLMVAVATAFVGVIAFVGLVVPHVLRLWRSSSHAFLLPASALLGASFALFVDVAARTVIAPAELPVGVLTSVVGAPVFLILLLRAQRNATHA